MLPDRVSNPGPLTYESAALPIALRGPAWEGEKGKTGREIHGDLADVYGSSAPSSAQVKFWVGELKRGRTSLEDVATCRPLNACIKMFGIWYSLIGEFRWKK